MHHTTTNFHTKFGRKLSFGRYDTMLHGVPSFPFTEYFLYGCLRVTVPAGFLASSTLETSLLTADIALEGTDSDNSPWGNGRLEEIGSFLK